MYACHILARPSAFGRSIRGRCRHRVAGKLEGPLTEDWPAFSGILVAALGGAAIGVERQRSGHASGSRARFGGVRTFTLLGGLAGIAGWLITLNLIAIAAVLAAGAVAVIVTGYIAASRVDVDGTTEVAALVVLAAGIVAGLGWLALASGAIAVTTLLLVEKSRLHAAVGHVADDEMRAAARFGVMAIVVLPLLPEGPIAQLGGVRPRELWMLVLFFTGLSFAGYLARRMFGPGHGYALAGALGGLISSTSVTFTFARLSRAEGPLSRTLAVGVIAACTLLFPRVLVATFVLDAAVSRALMPYIIAPFAVGVLAIVLWLRDSAAVAGPAETLSNPLQIGPALQMAVTFQVVLFAVEWIRRMFGNPGLLVSGAILGLTDVDALTISMTRSAAGGTAVAVAVAAQAIAIGILSNCVLKLTLAAALGTPQFRRMTALVLAAMAIAIAVSIGSFR
jgi:uncharacterized membrane protein (DUF4010 family)